MGLSRHGTRELVAIGLACGALALLSVWYVPYLLPIPVLIFLFSLCFFRDPERSIPADDNILVSPADGTVADVREIDEDGVLNTRCLRIGIFLSIFDVHVNRCPDGGRVDSMQYREGAFHNAMSDEAAAENEAHRIGFRGTTVDFAVRQIAGLIARRIVCTLEPDQEIERGERLGMIKFGSRTELFVPLHAEPTAMVEEGDSVRGGETVLVRVDDATS